jgi:DHA2 family multidrug resistance protein
LLGSLPTTISRSEPLALQGVVFSQQMGHPVATKQMALQSLEDLRQQQVSAFAYFDTFFVFPVLAVALTFLVLLMRRSVVGQGAHLAAE